MAATKLQGFKKAFKRSSPSKRVGVDLNSLWLVRHDSIDTLFSRDEVDIKNMTGGQLGLEYLKDEKSKSPEQQKSRSRKFKATFKNIKNSTKVKLGKVKDRMIKEGEQIYTNVASMDYEKINVFSSRLLEGEIPRETSQEGIELECTGPEMAFYLVLAFAEYTVQQLKVFARKWWAALLLGFILTRII